MFESTVDSINSFRDSLGLKKAVTGVGSFRGVSFLVFREQRQSGGRRVVKREYPLRDAGGTHDLGRKLRERSFTCCVLGDDADDLRDALIEALEATGSGELVHPDFGTLQVIVDSYECRSNADELNYHEFTLTVFPEATDTAPKKSQDTASAVTRQNDSLFSALGDTLADAWETVQEATQGATAVLEAVNGVFDDISNAVESLGILNDVSNLMAAITAVKGNVQGLINTPALLAANLLGAFSGLSSVCDASTAFSLYETLGDNLRARADDTDVAYVGDAAAGNVNALFHVGLAATVASQAAAASGVLTQTISATQQADTSARAPELSTPTDSSSVSGTSTSSVSSTTLQVSDAGISQTTTTSVISDDSSVISSAYVTFESRADIEDVAAGLGATLDELSLAASAAGYTASAENLNLLRLVTIVDLRERGMQLPGVKTVTLRQTEPALVTLYRETGNSRLYQRLTRRNGLKNPLFVPGGEEVEVITDE